MKLKLKPDSLLDLHTNTIQKNDIGKGHEEIKKNSLTIVRHIESLKRV
jgi:hypothetical protein